MKKLFTMILCTALVIGIVGCESAERLNTQEEQSRREREPLCEAEPPRETKPQKNNPAPSRESLPDVEVTNKIRWLSWYMMNEQAPAFELFKERYSVPASEISGLIIERIPVTYESRYETLSAMVASDNSPDIFQYEDRFFPYGAFMSLFAPIDDVIDLSGREWDATRAFIEAHCFGDKNYTAITELLPSTGLLFYRKSTMQQYAFDDPYELWIRNQWTWDEFEQMCEIFTDYASENYGVMGWYIDEAIIATTGTPLIGLKDGRLQNNLDHGNIERAMNFAQRISAYNRKQTLSGMFDSVDKTALRSRNNLFWNDGPWVYEEVLQAQMQADGWDFDDIGIVPFPRDPHSHMYYTRGSHRSLMLVQGAKNIDGFKALTQCLVISAHDSKAQAQIREKKKLEHNWTDFQLDTLDKIMEMPVVFDFKNGIGTDIADATMASNVENLTKPVIMMGEHYTAMREAERAIIEMRINEINKSVR